MVNIGEAGRTRRDASRIASDKRVAADLLALKLKGRRAKGPGTSTNPRPGSGKK